MLDGFFQVRDGLFETLGVDVIVGISVVPLFHGAPVHGVALHLVDDVFGIINPVLLDVAFGKPCTGLPVDGRLCVVEASHIGKCGGGLGEFSAVEL